MRRGLLLFLAGPVLALASCASDGGGSAAKIRPLRPLEIATAPYQETVTAALVGSLLYEGNCLLFREEDSHIYLLPVWPTGTVFNGTSVIFHQPGKTDQRVVVGEEFLMSGQQLQYRGLRAGQYQSFERQCGVQPFFVSRLRPAN